LASIFAFAFATMASAQTVIHITGSTAFRAAAHQAILHILQSGAVYGYTGTSLNSASQAIFTGTTVAPTSTSVIIKTSWSGSVGGLLVLTNNLVVPNTGIGVVGGWLVNGTTQSTSGSPNANGSNIDPAATADASFSDSFQSSTLASTPVLTGANNYQFGIVGVIPFEWVKGNGAAAGITNVTSIVAQAALAGGVSLMQFTGNVADLNTAVEVIGRDSDSGTRLETFAETGFGIFTAPTQYQPTVTGGVITALNPWPGQFTDGTSYPAGHEGFASGGGVAGALNTPGSITAAGSPGYLIGYLGISDAGNVTTGAPLPFNGVGYTVNGVATGVYSMWAYEHIYYRNAYANPGKAVVDQLAARIHDFDAETTVAGILLSRMQVGRAVEGGVITPPNPF